MSKTITTTPRQQAILDNVKRAILNHPDLESYDRTAVHVEGTDMCELSTNLPCKNNGNRLIIISIPRK